MINKSAVVLLLVLAVELGAVDQLALAAKLPMKKGICKDELAPTLPDFQPEKVYNGHWYVGLSFGTFFSDVYRKCITLEAEYQGLNLSLNISEYVPVIFSTLYQSVNATLDPTQPYVVNLTLPMLNVFEVNISGRIIGTDNESYVVFYSCSPALGLDGYILESGWVLRRRRGDKSLMQEIREVIWRSGLPIEDFEWADNDGCK